MSTHRLRSLIASLSLILLGLVIGLALRSTPTQPDPLVGQIATPAAAQPATHGATKPQTVVTRTVQKVSPSVVTVGAVKRKLIRQSWFDTYSLARQRIPYLGSGFLVDKQGRIVTNFHVIDDSESLFVTLMDGRELPAKVLDADRYSDIALLQVDANTDNLPEPLSFGNSDELQIGEQVMAFGNPFGNLIEDSRPTVTVGYISALHRSFRPDQENQRVYQDMIQTDASINPGNSGGPLIDINGDVVGMNTFIFSPSGGNTGISFAIPATRVKGLVDEITRYGKLRPLLLDFAFRTLITPRLQGVQVFEVRPGGPAEQVDIKIGDVIVEAEGRPIASRDEFYLLFASRQVGDTVKLKLWREGRISDVVYTVKEAPR